MIRTQQWLIGALIATSLCIQAGCGEEEHPPSHEESAASSNGDTRQNDQALRARVMKAASATYIHGMTREIAMREVGAEGVPVLRELLSDPGFERRDNVVAMLGFLADDATKDALMNYLQAPTASLRSPEEQRAVLLVPHMLGHMAAVKVPGAEAALLEMTTHHSSGGVLAQVQQRGVDAALLRDNLMEMALTGLANAGTPATLSRLEAIADGVVNPIPEGRAMSRPARLVQLRSQSDDAQEVAAQSQALDGGQDEPTEGQLAPAVDDSNTRVDSAPMTYANHPAVGNPMSDARLDDVLADASLRAGRGDFDTDTVCCIDIQRSGSASSFGFVGDGLDVISTESELVSVLNNNVSRVKVVNAINWCGSPGTNIIGCAWIGGNGMALVRMSSVSDEAILWLHEYGHNVGLNHSNDSRFIMYGSVVGNNNGVSTTECNTFHNPSSGTAINLLDSGACTDNDADDVHDVLDNCPQVANTNQADANNDGVGDVCENPTVCGDGVADPGEACDGADLQGASCAQQGCASGTPSCTTSCTLDFGSCSDCPVCDNDGACEEGEDCNSCPQDCPASSGATCGNGTCEAGDGEDCVSCPQDCNGKQDGKPSRRFCCGDGDGQNPISCGDSRCNSGGFQCTNAQGAPSCCGDGACEGAEDGNSCALDCGAPPVCGDGTCNGDEDICSCAQDCGTPPASESSCTNGSDDDCDGATDCNDSDCSNDAACQCGQTGSACTSNGDCCSNKCKGPRGRQTCN